LLLAALLADIPRQPNVTHAPFVQRVHTADADLDLNVPYRFRSPELLHMDGSSSAQSSADTCRPSPNQRELKFHHLHLYDLMVSSHEARATAQITPLFAEDSHPTLPPSQTRQISIINIEAQSWSSREVKCSSLCPALDHHLTSRKKPRSWRDSHCVSGRS